MSIKISLRVFHSSIPAGHPLKPFWGIIYCFHIKHLHLDDGFLCAASGIITLLSVISRRTAHHQVIHPDARSDEVGPSNGLQFLNRHFAADAVTPNFVITSAMLLHSDSPASSISSPDANTSACHSLFLYTGTFVPGSIRENWIF